MCNEIYDYDERLNRYARRIRALRNGDIAIRFLNHLRSLGLSVARVSKYASHIPALLKVIDFNLQEASRDDVEKVMARINQQNCTEWRKHSEGDKRERQPIRLHFVVNKTVKGVTGLWMSFKS